MNLTCCISVMALVVVFCCNPSRALANPPPSSPAPASAEFETRTDNIVRRTITRLQKNWNGDLRADTWGLETEKPREFARHRIAMASAIIWVLSHPSRYRDNDNDAYYRLQQMANMLMGSAWSEVNYYATWRYWIGDQSNPGELWKLFDRIYIFSDPGCHDSTQVGTNCDYDFVLVDLAHLIYTYQDGDTPLSDPLFNWPGNPEAVRPPSPNPAWTYADFLTNEMIYAIICQRHDSTTGTRTCEYPQDPFPYVFGQLDKAAVFKQYVCGEYGVACTTTAETENHVLGILAWDYLATNWVMWQGSLTGGRRQHDAMSDLWEDRMKPVWFSEIRRVYRRTLRTIGRVLHSGMYETNSRPYGRVSFSALLAIAMHGMPMIGQYNNFNHFPIHPVKVRDGALNAVDYLQVKFAFQSLRGKRQGPMRRAEEFKKQIDFYQHNSLPVMMSMLSGSREWDDCPDATVTNQRPDCLILGWNNEAYRDSELATMLSASSTGYRMEPIIHEYMFERGPFYARMKSRYTDKHYPKMLGYPKYFVPGSTTVAFHKGANKSSAELYFGDDNILLAAGGSYKEYYGRTVNDVWAKPTMLIPRGDFGHQGEGDDEWEWREYEKVGDGVGDAITDVMLSPGKVWHWWASKCNVWVYRNFAYGYRFHDRHGAGGGDWDLAPEPFSRKHSFYVPEFWQTNANDFASFEIGDGHFEIYQFDHPDKLRPNSTHGYGTHGSGDGYFIVRARFRKYVAENGFYRKHREFSRGLLEIVPRHVFVDATHLEQEIKLWNNWSYFDGGDKNAPWVYVLTMSKEKIVMDPLMGSKAGGIQTCRKGILKIREPDFVNGDWGDPVDMEERFIPADVTNSDAMKRIPLITVWELNSSFEPTGCKLVETLDEGVLVVRQPAEICWQWANVGNQRVCTGWGPGWRCQKFDSHNYMQPLRPPAIDDYDCHCYEQR